MKDSKEQTNMNEQIERLAREIGKVDAIRELQDWFARHQDDTPEDFRREFYVFLKNITVTP